MDSAFGSLTIAQFDLCQATLMDLLPTSLQPIREEFDFYKNCCYLLSPVSHFIRDKNTRFPLENSGLNEVGICFIQT